MNWKQMALILSGGGTVYVEVLHDSQLDVDCAFANAADDTKRCILTAPSSSASDGSGRIYYRDSMCKGSAYVWLDPAPQGCTFNAPKYVYSYSQPPYYAPNNVAADALAHIAPNPQGMCGPSTGPQGQQQYVHYSLGSELPASSFVAGTPDTDP